MTSSPSSRSWVASKQVIIYSSWTGLPYAMETRLAVTGGRIGRYVVTQVVFGGGAANIRERCHIAVGGGRGDVHHRHRMSTNTTNPVQKPVMVYVFTDGSLASNGDIDNTQDGRGKGVWTGDNSSTSAAFFLVYNPAGRPTLMSSPTQTAAQHQQLGWMSASGSVVVGSTPGANSPNLLAEMCILNWMALHDGDRGNFRDLFPNSGLGTDIDRLIAFEPIV